MFGRIPTIEIHAQQTTELCFGGDAQMFEQTCIIINDLNNCCTALLKVPNLCGTSDKRQNFGEYHYLASPYRFYGITWAPGWPGDIIVISDGLEKVLLFSVSADNAAFRNSIQRLYQRFALPRYKLPLTCLPSSCWKLRDKSCGGCWSCRESRRRKYSKLENHFTSLFVPWMFQTFVIEKWWIFVWKCFKLQSSFLTAAFITLL